MAGSISTNSYACIITRWERVVFGIGKYRRSLVSKEAARSYKTRELGQMVGRGISLPCRPS